MKYRAEIDGVRAIAIFSVVFYHATIPGFGGGFVGVDVFFVISGFLITDIITREIAGGSFSFERFYVRRARRIVPALLFMLASTVPFAWLWLMPDEFREYAQSLLAAVFSFANIHFWTKAGYFAPTAENAPLLHTWSLAVEEQFYLLIPLLAVIVWRLWARSGLIIVFSLLAVMSLLLSQLIAEDYPASNFFLLPTRMWELLAGSLLSFVSFRRSGFASEVLSAAGVAMIFISIALYNSSTPFPSFYALLPVCGTALMLGFSSHDNIVGRFLAFPPFVWIGRISYSAYLWHQPLFVFARIRAEGELSNTWMFFLILMSFVLAYFSWYFIEQPFRKPVKLKPDSDKYFVRSVASFGAVLAVFAVCGNVSKGFPFRMPTEAVSFQQSTEWSRHCLFQDTQPFPTFPLEGCAYNPEHRASFAIWGDSVAASISGALASRLDAKDFGLIQITHGFCAPVRGVMRADETAARGCARFNEEAMKQILNSDRVSTVVLAGSWEDFFQAESYDIDGSQRTFAEGADRSEVSRRLASTIQELEAAGKTVALVYPHPRPSYDVTEVLTGRILRGNSAKQDMVLPKAKVAAELAAANAYLDAAATSRTIRVYPDRKMCESKKDGSCFVAVGGRPLISDRVHFSPFGSIYVVDGIMEAIGLSGDQPEHPLPFVDKR